MRKVYRLTVYRNTPVNAFGGRMSKEVVGEFETKDAAEAAYTTLKEGDPTVKSRVISVDWR